MAMEKFTVSIYEADIDLFERRRSEMGFSKSAYIRFLINEHENKIPLFIKDKELIKQIANLNTSIKELLIKNGVKDVDKLHIYENMESINLLLKEYLKRS